MLPLSFMVPVTGLEPVRCRQRWILSPLRLPFHHTGSYLHSIQHLFENGKTYCKKIDYPFSEKPCSSSVSKTLCPLAVSAMLPCRG